MRKDVRKFGISDKRGRQPTRLDPFVAEGALKDPSLCMNCKAVFQNQHWTLNPEAHDHLKRKPAVNWISCPACQKIAAGYPEGIVTLRGSYLWQHEKEIQQILRNEEQRAQEKNPFERIIRRQRDGDQLVIETTEKKFAERLGRVLHRSHQGTLDISWSGDPDVCRVTWERTL